MCNSVDDDEVWMSELAMEEHWISKNSFMDPKWVGSLEKTLKDTHLQAKEAINGLYLSQTQKTQKTKGQQ